MKIRKFIRSFYPPEKWRIPVIIVLGCIVGAGFYTFYIAKAWTYLSESPETCVNCHIMKTEYTTWRQSSHGRNTTCNDCHVPQDNFFRGYYFKAKDGLRHATIFTARAYSQSITMLEPGRKVVFENCMRCHDNLTDRVMGGLTYKEIKQGNGKVCWDCHREVPHGRVKSLSSTPWAEVPVPENQVPDWLSNILK
ncbi:MAG: cytochrome c nitrite reductase small subunit [Bacteroidales bacterium]|nr:cytochrome c nitrite reductase small subunit [Bacteroidales bacterium]